jgi:hypothetical protein
LINAPTWLVAVGFAVATLVISVAFGERVGFVMAVVAAALATPAFYFQAMALLAAAVATLKPPGSGADNPAERSPDRLIPQGIC